MGRTHTKRRTKSQDPPVSDTTAWFTRMAWNYRLELLLANVAFLLGWYGQWWVALVAVVILAGPPPNKYVTGWWPRRWTHHTLHVARLQRQWHNAAKRAGIEHPPRIGRVTEWPIGEKVTVRLTPDCTGSEVEKRAEKLATAMGLADVRVKRGKTQDRAQLVLVRRDPFDDLIVGAEGKMVIRPIPWPDLHADTLSMWDPINLGIDEDGTPVRMALIGSNVLLGGVPGSGKSAAESLIVAQAALDPNARLWCMDGKDVDLPVWEPCAHRYVGPDRKDAIDMLRELRDLTEQRFQDLKTESIRTGRPVRKVAREMGLPVHVLVCDELASYLLAEDKTGKGHAEKILELLRQIAAKGRAGAVIECLATQRPDAGTVDTKLRSLLTYRVAMRCTDYQSSDTITGGMASAGFDASDIPDSHKGVAWVCADTGDPTLTRTFYLTDDDIMNLASRAMGNAASRELLPPVRLDKPGGGGAAPWDWGRG